GSRNHPAQRPDPEHPGRKHRPGPGAHPPRLRPQLLDGRPGGEGLRHGGRGVGAGEGPRGCRMTRQNVSSNSPYEPVIGFSRAVRAGNHVFVSGTVGRGPDGSVVQGGVYEQTVAIIENIRAALEQAGASLSDVVRTRTYLVDIATQDEFARAHREA